MIQQRLHENDLAGYLLETGQWTLLKLTAIAEQDENILIGDNHYHLRKQGDVLHPELESLELLEQMKSTMGSQNFAAQYQQRPTPDGGDIVKLEWIKTYDKKPQQRSGDHSLASSSPNNPAYFLKFIPHLQTRVASSRLENSLANSI